MICDCAASSGSSFRSSRGPPLTALSPHSPPPYPAFRLPFSAVPVCLDPCCACRFVTSCSSWESFEKLPQPACVLATLDSLDAGPPRSLPLLCALLASDAPLRASLSVVLASVRIVPISALSPPPLPSPLPLARSPPHPQFPFPSPPSPPIFSRCGERRCGRGIIARRLP